MFHELKDTLTSPGWGHLEKMLLSKEAGASSVLFSAESMDDVKAARLMAGFVRWLIALPVATANKVSEQDELVNNATGEAEEDV